jgi:soluble lytic murein transglycosylase-like protein
MKLFVTTAIIVLIVGSTAPALRSQTVPDGSLPKSSPADRIRQRMEAAAERQKKSVASMKEAPFRTKNAAGRTQLASAETFFSLPTLAPVAGAPAVVACDPLPPAEVDSLVHTASASTSVDPRLITAVMKEESDYRPCAVSPKGAEGLMQLLPETAAELGVVDPFGPKENVLAGAKLLRQLMDHYNGDLALVLSAYNAGSGTVDSTMSVPHFVETQNYVRDILSRLSPVGISPIGISPTKLGTDLLSSPQPSLVESLLGENGALGTVAGE